MRAERKKGITVIRKKDSKRIGGEKEREKCKQSGKLTIARRNTLDRKRERWRAKRR